MITKLPVNKLKPLMSKIVGPEQASFVIGHQIVDDIISLRKIFTL